jgi:hypothetical protein
VRQQLEQAQMPVEETPSDDAVRQSYNFAPGYHGLVYRADVLEHGGEEQEAETKREGATGDTRYKLQSMQWGRACNPHMVCFADHRQVWCRSGQSATSTTAAR